MQNVYDHPIGNFCLHVNLGMEGSGHSHEFGMQHQPES